MASCDGESLCWPGEVVSSRVDTGATSLPTRSMLRRPDVGYSQALSFLIQGPQMGLTSSHFRCRFRHVMLHRVRQARHGWERPLTIRSSSAGPGLETCGCVAVCRAHSGASLRCHGAIHCRCCRSRALNPCRLVAQPGDLVSGRCPFFPSRWGSRDPPRYPAFSPIPAMPSVPWSTIAVSGIEL